MSMRLWGAVVLVVAALACGTALAHAQPRILPTPLELRLKPGRFALPDSVTIALASARPADRFAAELLARELAERGRPRVGISSGTDGAIVLGEAPRGADLGEEGYELQVTGDRIHVRASHAAGVFHGMQSLRQLIEREGVPCLEIRDRPALRWRGTLEDLSRGPVPTLAALKQRVEMLSELKLNLYALYLENVIEYPGHPLPTRVDGSLSLEEFRELGEHAERFHITLMPVQQTLGHMGAWLAHERYRGLAASPGSQTLAPDAPATTELLAQILRPLAAHTPGPWVHIGCDEAEPAAPAGASVSGGVSGPSLVRFIQRERDLLAAAGKRTMVWGDGLLAPDVPLAKLPRDVVVATWKYEASNDYATSIEPFKRAGVPFIVCPGAWNWRRVFPDVDAALSNIRTFTRQGRAAGAIGQITCTWGDGGEALFPLTWYPVAGGAMAAWSEAGLDTSVLRRDFDWWWLRAKGQSAASSVQRLARVNPLVWESTALLAEPLFTWLDPFHPVNRGVLERLSAASPELTTEMEGALEDIARARAVAGRGAAELDHLEFAARRIVGIANRASSAQRARALYLEAHRASQAGGDRTTAGARLDAVRDLYAQTLDRALENRDAFTKLWDQAHQPAGRSRVLAQYERDVDRWLDRLELFRMLRLLIVNGRPLPPAQEVGFDPER